MDKISIIISKGSLDGIYPGLIMANGARAEGMDANLFFTFFGLDAIHKERHEHIKMATVGNPGLHLATMLGGLPGVSSVMTHYMNHKMEEMDIPSVPEFVEMIADTGAGLYACKASVDLFGDGANLGTMPAGSYLVVAVPAGAHRFRAGSDAGSELALQVLPGRAYFVRATDAPQGAVRLRRTDVMAFDRASRIAGL